MKKIKTIIISTIVSTIAIIGVIAAIKLIKEHVNAVTGNGSNVTITAGSYINYGSWGTHVYTVGTDGNDFRGFCVEPRKNTPSGTYKAKISADSDKNNMIKLALYAYRGKTQAAKDLMNQIFASGSFTDNKYVYIHAVVGYIYSNDSTGLDTQQKNFVDEAKAVLWTHIQGETDVWTRAKDWRLYELGNVSSSDQNIMWIENNRQYANIAVVKCDTINTNCVPSGAANFGNVEFTLVYNGSSRVYDGNREKFYSAGDVVATATTDASGTVVFTDLPLGRYVVGETGMNNPSLELSGGEQEVNLTSGNTTKSVTFKNQIVRGDVKFAKVDEEGRMMPHIPFRITSKTTGESHIVVSNFAGIVNTATSHIPHSENTNGYDSMADLTNVSFQGYGTWFGREGSTGATAPVNNDVGALPYDTYTIQELSCVNNQSCQNISSQTKEFTISSNFQVVDLGNWVNNCSDYSLETVAVDATDGDKAVSPTSGVRIKDTVSYKVKKEVPYTIVANLIDKTNRQPVMHNGQAVSAYVVIPQSNSGQGTVEMNFDFDATNLVGHTLVIFSYLFEDGVTTPLVLHEDWDNLSQSVIVPSISTEAYNAEGNTKQIKAAPNQTIIDTVSYCLLPGRQYKIITALVNTNHEKILINGAEVASEKTISIGTGSSSCDSVNTSLTFDATSLVDQDIMIAQAIIDVETNTQVGTTHFDPGDGSQIVTVAEAPPEEIISTEAIDPTDGDKNVEAANNQVIRDRVNYCLIAGQEYVLSSSLMDENRQPIATNNGLPSIDTTFTPRQACESIDIYLSFDASSLAGTSVTVVHTLKKGGTTIYLHHDYSGPQSVTVAEPTEEITSSEATDDADGDKIIEPTSNQTINDQVSYCLVAGRQYTIVATLYGADRQPLTIGGQQVETRTTFTPSQDCGSIDITIDLDASSLSGSDIIVVQELYRDNTLIDTHAVYSGSQTVTVSDNTPDYDISTTAVDKADGDKNIIAASNQQIKDTIDYCLVAGESFTIEGVLMDKSTGRAVTVGGHTIENTITFTPQQDCGRTEMTFDIDTSTLGGHTIVVYETAYDQSGTEVASHRNIRSTNQSVVVVNLGTTARDNADNDKYLAESSNQTITDTIDYCLFSGKSYTIEGTLMDKETGNPVRVNGSEITETMSFTPRNDNHCGQTTMTFNVDTTALAGHSIVVYETVYDQNHTEVVSHRSLEDASQSVTVVKLLTTAVNGSDDSKKIEADANQAIKDTIDYCLLKNKEYTIKGVLMDKETGNPVSVGGHTIENTITITPRSNCGQTTMVFYLDATDLSEHNLVVYEKVYDENNTLVVSHEDINSDDQAVFVKYRDSHVTPDEPGEDPTLSLDTEATDNTDGDQIIEAKANQTIKDEIHYCLIPGRNYTIKGILMDQETNEPVKVNGATVENSINLTPQTECGSVTMVFYIDASELAGRRVVVFESAYENNIKVVSHEDIEAESQTISVFSLATIARDALDEDKNVLGREGAKVKDKIDYCLNAGDTYTIIGILMDKSTGDALKIRGETVTSEVTITPESNCGSTEMIFEFDATNLQGKELVVYESAYQDDELIITHSNLNDESQTVSIYLPVPDTGLFTGFDFSQDAPRILAIVGIVGGACICIYTGAKRYIRKKSFKFN